CVRAAVPVDARGREARNQLLALSAVHGAVSVRARVCGRVPHLPRGADARRRRALEHRGMSAVLQEVLVAVLVTACALYSAWRLLWAALRLRCLDALAALPVARTAPWLTALRRHTLSRLGAGCGS